MYLLASISIIASWAAADGTELHCDAPSVSQPLGADPHHLEIGGTSRLLYVNPCVGGCTLSPGSDDSVSDTSTLAESRVTLAEFPHGEQVWSDMMGCLRDMYAPYNINVTDTYPGDQPHFETMIAGTNTDLGRPSAAGVAPFACGGNQRAISFVFAHTIAGDARTLCEVAAHESGHTFGLEHAYLCEDPMTYLNGCGAKTFQDSETSCGEDSPRACECSESQNTVRRLLTLFGPGGLPATAEILNVGAPVEDPSTSNGDGILSPGERVTIDLRLINSGNETISGGTVRLFGDMVEDGIAELPEVAPGFEASAQASAELKGNACGEEVEFEIVTQVGNESSTATATVLVGVEQAEVAEAFATDGEWQRNAQQSDTAMRGIWQYGAPEMTSLLNETLQPSAGPNGGSVWMTGLDGSWDDDQVGGITSLTSSPYDLSSWEAVTELRYNLWYVALDRPALDPAETSHLKVEISTDDSTWTTIDEVSGQNYRWEERSVSLLGVVPGPQTRLRFTATNEVGPEQRLVEVGLAGVTFVGGSLVCNGGSGGAGSESGGCVTGGGRTGGIALLLLVVGLVSLRRTRRLR